MVKSMTAFSRANRAEDSLEILVEIRSYNSRYLDIALRMPHDYLPLEDRIRKEVSHRLTRGRLEISISIQDRIDPGIGYELDRERARAFFAVLVQLKEAVGLDLEFPLELIANANGVIKSQALEKDVERCWPLVKACMEDALQALDAMRCAEGDALRQDLIPRLIRIEQSLRKIEDTNQNNVNDSRLRLQERISALVSQDLSVDPTRIAQEAAILAVKRDISEEITRSKSHLAQFRKIMDSTEPGGKTLSFLLQEINREFNTMGAKAENVDAAHAVVDVKSELEKIREQVLNVE